MGDHLLLFATLVKVLLNKKWVIWLPAWDVWRIFYLIESMVVGIEEGWAHMMAGVPASLTYLLMLAARSDASIPWSTPDWSDLAVDVGTNCGMEVFADALSLCR
jgi:hypothetical protein